MLKAKNKFKKIDENNEIELAEMNLIKTMQQSSFVEEINFLKNPLNKNPPDLVRNLNLFIDVNGLVRTRGRLNKNEMYEYNLLNPILLPKNNQLTKFFILQAHTKCQHLGINSTLTMLRLNGF